MRKPGKHMRLLSAAGFMLSAALAGAEVIDTTIDYSTNPTNGQWTLWPGSSSTCEVLSNTGWDSGNGKYIIEAKLPATCPYMYFRTPFAHALDGTSALEAKIKVEAASGSLLYDATVRLGYGIDIPGFGIFGNTIGAFSYDTTSAGVQTVGGDYTSFISNMIATTQDGFMLSEPGDLLAKSTGPVIFVKNITVGSATPRAVTLTITIDDLHVQHDGSALDSSYETAATDAAGDYSDRIDLILDALDTDINTAKSAIDGLSLSGHPALVAAMSAEATEIQDDHDDIVDWAAVRTGTIKVPTQDQYERDVAGLQALNSILTLSTFVDGGGNGLVYYPWEATGKTKFDDLSLGVSGTPMQTSTNVIALNELEPVSVVLQNLNTNAVSISQVEPGTFTNQFGEEFPNARIDVRLVKNWYTGNARRITVRGADVKIRVPELLLKDDALVRVDAGAKSNELRIESNSTVFYQDISSPTAQMPNDAVVEDAATLQPFEIDAFHARQVWLTVDTRSDVRPGSYSGNLVVSYQIDGDPTPRTLDVPLELIVLPVALQSSDLTYGIYYRARIDASKAGLNSEYKTETQYLADLQNMLEHGVDHPMQYLLDSTPADLSAYVSLRMSVGLPCDKFFVLGGIGFIRRDATAAEKNAEDLLEALHGNPSCTNARLYMYGEDEAAGSNLDAQIAAFQAVTNAGAYSYVSGYTGTHARVGDWLDTIVFNGKPNDAEIDLWREDGKDVYSYANPQVGVPNPYIYRSNFGLLLWQHDYTGAMDYAYQDGFPGRLWAGGPLSNCVSSTTHYCSLWNDFDSSSYYDHVFTYPTTTGVIDTIQWEGFREAVDDTRYLATLQTALLASTDTVTKTYIEDMLALLKDAADVDPALARYSMQLSFEALNQPPQFANVMVATGADEVHVYGEASDPEGYLANVEVQIDGGPWVSLGSNGTWYHKFSGVSDGVHTVRYRATDYWEVSVEDEDSVEVDTLSPGC